MDKFSRTTEIDTAGVLNAIEQDTPKKSRRGNIIALIICIIVAIGIWAYVMYTDPEIHEKEFNDIKVTCESEDYTVEVLDDVDVVLKGTNISITEVSKSDIKVVILKKEIVGTGEYRVDIKCFIENQDNEIEIIPSTDTVLVRVSEK